MIVCCMMPPTFLKRSFCRSRCGSAPVSALQWTCALPDEAAVQLLRELVSVAPSCCTAETVTLLAPSLQSSIGVSCLLCLLLWSWLRCSCHLRGASLQSSWFRV